MLLLGLSFIPTPKFSDTDLEKEWTELNQHIRRIEWENVYKDADQDSNPDEENIPPKLKFLKHNRPLPACIDEETNAYTDLCTAQLRNIKPKIKKQYEKNNNLTPELQASLKKLTDIAKRGKHVFCRSDKDGKIIIISRTDFDLIMTRELQKDKVQDLQTNDIDKHLQTIKNDMEAKVEKLHLAGGISDELLLHTIGLYTDENGRYCRVKKYAKYFTIGTLGYSYPLFKTHKLNEQMIKETPSPHIPVRIVNAVSNITTSRCTAMLEAILKPISILYCGEEYTRDSSHYLEALISWKEKKIATQPLESQYKNLHLIAADVQALYLRCNRSLVRKALQEALRCSTFSQHIQSIIVDLVMYCMENVITRFGDELYTQSSGIITGDNNSVSIANIAMRFIMKTADEILSKCDLVRRFIDDLIMIYLGSLESAEEIKYYLSEIFAEKGLSLTFRHAHSENEEVKEVEYLDINHVLDPEDPLGFITKDFIKPTAINRVFLHGSSYHPLSTFKSILKISGNETFK